MIGEGKIFYPLAAILGKLGQVEASLQCKLAMTCRFERKLAPACPNLPELAGNLAMKKISPKTCRDLLVMKKNIVLDKIPVLPVY